MKTPPSPPWGGRSGPNCADSLPGPWSVAYRLLEKAAGRMWAKEYH